MSAYEIIQHTIRLSPFVILLLTYIFLHQFKWYQRLAVMFFLGWAVIAASTLLFWSYSINYAPDQETAMYLAQKDGAPRLFGTLFGWVFGLIYLLILEAIRFGLDFLMYQAKGKTSR
jgi:hypothetical protein